MGGIFFVGVRLLFCCTVLALVRGKNEVVVQSSSSREVFYFFFVRCASHLSCACFFFPGAHPASRCSVTEVA